MSSSSINERWNIAEAIAVLDEVIDPYLSDHSQNGRSTVTEKGTQACLPSQSQSNYAYFDFRLVRNQLEQSRKRLPPPPHPTWVNPSVNATDKQPVYITWQQAEKMLQNQETRYHRGPIENCDHARCSSNDSSQRREDMGVLCRENEGDYGRKPQRDCDQVQRHEYHFTIECDVIDGGNLVKMESKSLPNIAGDQAYQSDDDSHSLKQFFWLSKEHLNVPPVIGSHHPANNLHTLNSSLVTGSGSQFKVEESKRTDNRLPRHAEYENNVHSVPTSNTDRNLTQSQTSLHQDRSKPAQHAVSPRQRPHYRRHYFGSTGNIAISSALSTSFADSGRRPTNLAAFNNEKKPGFISKIVLRNNKSTVPNYRNCPGMRLGYCPKKTTVNWATILH